MSHVFLSYSRKDAERAERLAAILESQGLKVWWDRTIPPGKTFDQVIEEALEAASWVVVLWSGHSVGSNWVKSEAGEALRRGVLVPVLIDDVQAPLAFRRIEAADLRSWEEDTSDPEFLQLVRVLGGKAPPPAPPPETRQPQKPTPDPLPEAPPRRRGLSSGAKIAIGLSVAFLLLVAVGIGVVAIVGQKISGEGIPAVVDLAPVQQQQPPPKAVIQEGRAGNASAEPQVEAPAPAIPRTGNIVLQYLGDEYSCVHNLTIRVGNQSYVLSGNILPVNGVALGPAQYAVSGTISCPYFGSCGAVGSGVLEVYDGAVYNLMWQNTTVGQCQVSFVDGGYR